MKMPSGGKSMGIEAFLRREKMLELRERLLAVEEDRQAGNHDCSIDELDSYLSDTIGSVKKHD